MKETFILSAISTQTTTNVLTTANNITLHTVTCPKATTGTITFEDITGSPVTYFVLPVGSIGSFRLDVTLSNGLKVVTAAADTVLISYQLP